MAKKDERNLNITINNHETDDGVVISFTTLVKKLKKYLLIWIITAVFLLALAFGYAGFTTHVNKAHLTAVVSFSYDGIEKGLDPSGRDFDEYSIKNPAVIEASLTELGISLEELEYIRQGIEIEGILPKDTVQRLTVYSNVLNTNGSVSVADKILETSYFPTQYKVYFDYNKTSLTDKEAVKVFNSILDNYKDYFYKTYGYNTSLGNAVTAIDYNDYDYGEAIDVFDNSLSSLKKYVRDLANDDDTRFRSSVTGYTFSDLYEAIDVVESIDLDKISSYVTVNNLTKDKEAALAYYEYRIKALGRQKSQYEEQLAVYENSIENYQKDQIIIYGGSEDTNTQSTLASKQYDKMFGEKNEIASNLARTKQLINDYKDRQQSLKTKTTGSSSMFSKVDEDLEKLNEKINNLVDLVCDTSEDYYKNVTFKNAYNVLVPATNTTSDKISRVIENAKLPAVILELLGFVVYFAVAFVQAFTADNKKKDEEEAEEEKSKDDEDKSGEKEEK